MRLKRIKIFMSVLLAFVLMIGTVMPAQAASSKNWKKIYAEYLNTLPKDAFPKGRFIYVNNDNIPELYLEGAAAYVGNKLLVIYNGKVNDIMLEGHGSFKYLKKKNRYYITGGHMDNFYDFIGKLKKGKLANSAEGFYGAENNANVKFDKNGEPIYKYTWNNKKVSKKAYEKKLKQKLGKNIKKYKDAYSYGNMDTLEQIIYSLS